MEILATAWQLISGWDATLSEIVGLSLRVSGVAVCLAALFALPIGACLAAFSFPGRALLVAIFTAFMGLPPVVVGLFVYLLLSRAGPLGDYGLLFTPEAMILAQTVLIFPIITTLTREALLPLYKAYRDLFISLDVRPFLMLRTLLWDGRFAVATSILAGFGRAMAEVGAVLIVGGNIDGLTRVMTTTIALETSKGNLELALALGLVLIGIAFAITGLTQALMRFGRRYDIA